MFGDHWSSASEDIRHLICHVTLQDLVLEELCDIKGGRSSLYVTTLSSFLAIVEAKYVFDLSCDLARRHDERVM